MLQSYSEVAISLHIYMYIYSIPEVQNSSSLKLAGRNGVRKGSKQMENVGEGRNG
jgi:hypothetical protein